MLKKSTNLLAMVAIALGIELFSYLLQKQLVPETKEVILLPSQGITKLTNNTGTLESSASLASPNVGVEKNEGLFACLETDCNCSDFSTQAEAKAVLDAEPGDPHRLDANGDGIPCESLSNR